MKNLMKLIVKTIGWKQALAFVWELADDGIKEHVKKTPQKWDDKAVEVLDQAIKQLTSDQLEQEA